MILLKLLVSGYKIPEEINKEPSNIVYQYTAINGLQSKFVEYKKVSNQRFERMIGVVSTIFNRIHFKIRS